MKHTLSVLVENKPGVLTRITGLFARRGFNLDSLSVGETENAQFSRMIITLDGQDQSIDQVQKQLHKLINVIKITELKPETSIERELVLIKVRAEARTRPEIMQMVEIFEAKILDVSHENLVVEVTGSRRKVDSLIDLLRPFHVIEVVRTGIIAVGRG